MLRIAPEAGYGLRVFVTILFPPLIIHPSTATLKAVGLVLYNHKNTAANHFQNLFQITIRGNIIQSITTLTSLAGTKGTTPK